MEIEGVSLVVGTHQRNELLKPGGIPCQKRTTCAVRWWGTFSVEEFEELPVSTFEGRTRATLKIQDGCNQFCAYCRVPYARVNPGRSLESVVEQAAAIAAQG